jgi:cell division protein ZapA
MGQVAITVNDHSFTVACDDGQEGHVTELAQYIDGHVSELSSSVGQVGDARLLLMAGLLVADELSEMVNRVDTLQSEIEEIKLNQTGSARKANTMEAKVADILEGAAKQIEKMTERVESKA